LPQRRNVAIGNRQKKKFPRKMQHVEPIKQNKKKNPIIKLNETNNNKYHNININDNNNLYDITDDDDVDTEIQYSEITTKQLEKQQQIRPKHYVENIVYNFPFNSLPEEGHIFILEGGISVGKQILIYFWYFSIEMIVFIILQ
jgi:hypothetical protein